MRKTGRETSSEDGALREGREEGVWERGKGVAKGGGIKEGEKKRSGRERERREERDSESRRVEKRPKEGNTEGRGKGKM